MSKGRDYHDYVIKDGRLVGRFEDMYREVEGVPWHQDETAFNISSNIDLLIINSWKKKLGINSLIEIGAGLGYFTNRIKTETDIKSVVGADISSTAIQSAKQRFSRKGLDFIVLDMTDAQLDCSARFDIVMQKEVLWYVLDDLEVFFNNMQKLSNRYMYISQCFPGADEYLGKETFPNAKSLLDYVSGFSKILYSNVEYDIRADDGRELVHILMEKK